MPTLSPERQKQIYERRKSIRQLDPVKLIPSSDRVQHSVKDLQKGSFFEVEGKTYHVLSTGKYAEQGGKATWEWFEYKTLCLETGEVVIFEWEDDDGLKVSRTLAKLDQRNIQDDEGERFEAGDAEDYAKNKWDIVFNRQLFEFEIEYEATYTSDDPEQDSYKGYFYGFKSSNGQTITVEEWVLDEKEDDDTDYDYAIYLSEEMSPHSIVVIAI